MQWTRVLFRFAGIQMQLCGWVGIRRLFPTCVCVRYIIDGYSSLTNNALGTCPHGAAWFDEASADDKAHAFQECSNAGICDQTKGECLCMQGFEGAACERLKCPGPDFPCSNHGNCLTMSQLAAASTINGVPMGFTYGKTANKPTVRNPTSARFYPTCW